MIQAEFAYFGLDVVHEKSRYAASLSFRLADRTEKRAAVPLVVRIESRDGARVDAGKHRMLPVKGLFLPGVPSATGSRCRPEEITALSWQRADGHETERVTVLKVALHHPRPGLRHRFLGDHLLDGHHLRDVFANELTQLNHGDP